MSIYIDPNYIKKVGKFIQFSVEVNTAGYGQLNIKGWRLSYSSLNDSFWIQPPSYPSKSTGKHHPILFLNEDGAYDALLIDIEEWFRSNSSIINSRHNEAIDVDKVIQELDENNSVS